MGVELFLACPSCREWAWLGSAKPEKWQGFQVGNEAVAQWLVAHAHLESAPVTLEFWRDDGDAPPWSLDPTSWREDARSLGVTMGGRAPGAFARVEWSRLGWAKTLWLACVRCGEEQCVGRIADGAATLDAASKAAQWMIQHTAPKCSLTSRVA